MLFCFSSFLILLRTQVLALYAKAQKGAKSSLGNAHEAKQAKRRLRFACLWGCASYLLHTDMSVYPSGCIVDHVTMTQDPYRCESLVHFFQFLHPKCCLHTGRRTCTYISKHDRIICNEINISYFWLLQLQVRLQVEATGGQLCLRQNTAWGTVVSSTLVDGTRFSQCLYCVNIAELKLDVKKMQVDRCITIVLSWGRTSCYPGL